MSFYGDYSQTEGEAATTQSFTEEVVQSSTFDDNQTKEFDETYDGDYDPDYQAEQVAKDPATGIENLNVVPPMLRFWNIAAFVFTAGQAGVLGWLASESTTNWPIYVNFPITLNTPQGTGGVFQIIPDPKEIAAFPIAWYSCVFLALAALDHFIVFMPGTIQKYEYYIERHQNPFRWTEYAFSASLMRVMIAQLAGVTDLHILFGIFMLTAITMLLGSIHESVNAVARADGYRQNWYPFLAAFLPHFASWFIIFCYFFVAVSREPSIPVFVWIVIWVLFILDGCFAILFYLQWGKIWIFRDYVKGEVGFIVLSFTAKSALAWITYGGGSR